MIEFETDSRKVKPGQTFVAIKGFTVDGHDYVKSAVENGATKVVIEHDVDTTAEKIMVNDSKEYLKNELVNKYSDYLKDLTIIGVTGTNGKTTTCYLVYQMLNKLGIKCAYMGTIGFYYRGHKEELPNTTPELLTVYKLLYEAKDNGCTHIVMEVSSHSLEEERIAGLNFTVGAFTNLTQDHLDFHKTMENYLNAKLKIFNYLKPDGTFVLNNDDEYSKYFINPSFNTIKIGYKEDSNLLIKNANYSSNGTVIDFKYKDKDEQIKTNLISSFNVYNYLTSYAIVSALDIEEEKIKEITTDIYPPKGRCEIVEVNNGVAVIDYAHTPDAVEKVIKSFIELKQNRIITIVGCGGDRDPIKRPIMGKTACALSDHVIFTNDNPRTEDPVNIMNDITNNLEYSNFEIEYDRKGAIFKGIDMMEPNDILLILGKGHEDYQILGKEKVHFDDREVVEEWKNR